MTMPFDQKETTVLSTGKILVKMSVFNAIGESELLAMNGSNDENIFIVDDGFFDEISKLEIANFLMNCE